MFGNNDREEAIMIVIKIGGSVLANEARYQQMARNIKQLQDDVCVVVSARQGETEERIREIRAEDEAQLRLALAGDQEYATYNVPEVARHMVQGEIDSAHRLAQYIDGAEIVVQDGRFPIIANHSYLCGRVEEVKEWQPKGKCAVIAGYGAINGANEVVLLGRNSSDLVAAWMARIVDAQRLVYVKDVEEVFADFGSDNQRMLDHISLAEARKAGKVLDARICDVIEEQRFDVRIGHFENIEDLAEGRGGTCIQTTAL
jgi:aspartokinase